MDHRYRRQPGPAGVVREIGSVSKPASGFFNKVYKGYKIGSDYREKWQKIKERYEEVKGLLDEETRPVEILKIAKEWVPKLLVRLFEMEEEEARLLNAYMKFYEAHFKILEALIDADCTYESSAKLKAAAEAKCPEALEEANVVFREFAMQGDRWKKVLRLVGEWNVGVSILRSMLEARAVTNYGDLWKRLIKISADVQHEVGELYGHWASLKTVTGQIDDFVAQRKEKLDFLQNKNIFGYIFSKQAEKIDILDVVQGKTHIEKVRQAMNRVERLAQSWTDALDQTMIRTL